MRPLGELSAVKARDLEGLVFDLDGTLLTDGVLTLEAYEALHRLGATGLRLVACTGRPAGWGEVITRLWPIALAVTENGAVGFVRDGTGVATIDRVAPSIRAERRRDLDHIVEQLRVAFSDVDLADDNRARLTDVTFDIGERRNIPLERACALRHAATALGARTFLSSIHLHVTLDTDDKASGTVFALASAVALDPGVALGRYAFIGDSANDEACFNAFHTTFGVRNIVDHLGSLTVGPSYLSEAACGAGFTEIAQAIATLREGS